MNLLDYSNLLPLISLLLCLSLTAGGVLVIFRIERSKRQHAHQYLQYSLIFLYLFGYYSLWGQILLPQFLDVSATDIGITTISQMGAPFLLISLLMLLLWFSSVLDHRPRHLVLPAVAIVSLLVLAFLRWGWNVPELSRAANSIAGFSILTLIFAGLVFWKSKLESTESRHLILALSACSGLLYLSYFTSLVQHEFYEPVFAFLFFLFNTALAMEFVFATSVGAKKPFDEFIENFKISKREGDVMQEIYAGKTNQEIANTLFISLQTVKDHSSRIYQKVQVKNRNQLTAILRDVS